MDFNVSIGGTTCLSGQKNSRKTSSAAAQAPSRRPFPDPWRHRIRRRRKGDLSADAYLRTRAVEPLRIDLGGVQGQRIGGGQVRTFSQGNDRTYQSTPRLLPRNAGGPNRGEVGEQVLHPTTKLDKCQRESFPTQLVTFQSNH